MYLNDVVYDVEFLASYDDGSDPPVNDPPVNDPPVNDPPVNDPPKDPPSDEKKFTQADLNRILADEKRKDKEKYSSLETSYQELLKNQNLSKEERDGLEKQLEDLQARYRTKEQQLAYDKKQAEEKYHVELEELKNKATDWEKRYTESTINRELQAAAIEHDAYNPDLVVTHLKAQTNLEEITQDGKPTGRLAPMVTMTIKNEDTGIQENLKMTPSEAVEYMKKSPERYGGFFKNNIREGIGATSATGGDISGNGVVDVTKLSDEQYFKLRKENPAALGLKPLQR